METITGSICSLYLSVCVLLSFPVAISAETDPYPNVIIPIFKGGYNLKRFFDTPRKTKSIHYYVQTGFPPAELLEFYDRYFNGNGWQPSFEVCQRNWEDLSKEKQTSGLLLRQLFASWGHPELNIKAILWLTYGSVDNGTRKGVIVKCRLQPKVGA